MPTLMGTQDWVSIILNVSDVAGTNPEIVFGLQWSNDGGIWADATPAKDEFAPITAPCTIIRRFDVKAKYFRPYVNVTGDGASFTGSANAYY
jgi:hypothetical protein